MVSTLELVPSKLEPVPHGSPMSYQCPPEKSCGGIMLHHMASDFPALTLMLKRLLQINTLHSLVPSSSSSSSLYWLSVGGDYTKTKPVRAADRMRRRRM